MRRLPALFLIATAACSTIKTGPNAAQAEQYRRGSIRHAFGAPLLLSGVGGVIGSGIAFGVAKGAENARGPQVNVVP